MALTAVQQSYLEHEALLAFSGASEKLENGFRIKGVKGQVAAVYWSALNPTNEVEIALAPARLTDSYALQKTQAWLELVKLENPSPCAIHKHGSDWPIFGFRLTAALAFLRECRLVRRGFLGKDRLNAIEGQLQARTPERSEIARLEMELEQLRPTKQHAVIDLVRQAGISVEPWYVKLDGTPAAKPRSNPAYCYNWSFGGVQFPVLACLWHASMKIVDGNIELHENLRELALRLERVTQDTSRPPEHKDRARQQAGRARKLDDLIAGCANTGQELRVIVNEGDMRSESSLGEDSSVVRVRLLDSQPWQVTAYQQDTGAFTLRRKIKVISSAKSEHTKKAPVQFADQHDLLGSDQPERTEMAGTVVRRDASVRSAVLERAQGRCEFCDAPGFAMIDGRLYLETHHVQPLADDGADKVVNVLALCPTHHREAHYGARKMQLRTEFEELLDLMHPRKRILDEPTSSTA